MKSYFGKLKSYVENHPIQFDENCEFPALDSLYWHFSECHSMTNAKAKKANQDLGVCLQQLFGKDCDKVFSLVCTLCAEHEKIAFFAGLRLGAQLMLELQQEDE